jgi:hypothetical protein
MSLAPKHRADAPRTREAGAVPSSQRSAGTQVTALDDGRAFLDALSSFQGFPTTPNVFVVTIPPFVVTMPPSESGSGDDSDSACGSDTGTPQGNSRAQDCVALLQSQPGGDDVAAHIWNKPFESGQAVIDSKRAGRLNLTMSYDGAAFSVAARAGSSRLRSTLDRERARLEAALSEAAGLPVSLQIDTEAYPDDAVDRAPARFFRG